MPYKDLEKRRKYSREYLSKHRDRCWQLQKENWIQRPWLKTLSAISSRCSGRHHSYFKRGIKNFLKAADIKFLWFRDKAWLLTKPSIDRIDGSKHYSLNNCRFIELTDNLRRKHYA